MTFSPPYDLKFLNTIFKIIRRGLGSGLGGVEPSLDEDEDDADECDILSTLRIQNG